MASQELIVKVAAYVERVMSEYDASHDFEHIKRVIGGAHTIYNRILETKPDHELNLNIITLGALCHDIGDHKYLKVGEDGKVMVLNLLLTFGADAALAEKIQKLVNGVSFTNEIKHGAEIKQLVAEIPELAVVQDADRLDAIGALGLGRLFTFGGAKKHTPMQASMDLLDLKLFKIESYIKTKPGQEMAKVGTERLKLFNTWWAEEAKMADVQWMPTLYEAGGAFDAKVAFDKTAAAIEKATSDKKAEMVEQFTVIEGDCKDADSKTSLAEELAVIEMKSGSQKKVTPFAEDVAILEAKPGGETEQTIHPKAILTEQFDRINLSAGGQENQVVDPIVFFAEQLAAIKLKYEEKENIKPKA